VLASGGGAIGTAAATYKTEGPPVAVRLGGGDPISLTVMDANHRPVVGARVRIWRVGPVWVRPSAEADQDPEPVAGFWPKPTVTDADGKLSFPGLGGPSPVIAEVLAPGYARTDVMLSEQAVKVQVYPLKWVSGNVRAADTGKPIAGVEIGYPARFSATEVVGHRPFIYHRVGRDGSFRIPVPSTDYMFLRVRPPAGSRLRALDHDVDLDGRQQADVQLTLSSADP
jgi:hypothetical protein